MIRRFLQDGALRDIVVEALFGASGDALVIVERGTRTIIDCNLATEKLFGWTLPELRGQTAQRLHAYAEDWHRIPSRDFAALAAGTIVEQRFLGRDRHGRVFPTRVRAKGFTVGDTHYNVLSIHELTALEKAEAGLQHHAWALGERVKELRCLHGVAETLAQIDRPLRDRLAALPPLLQAAMQFPEVAHARITWGASAFATANYCAIATCEAAQAVQGKEPIGIVVGYGAEVPCTDGDPFLGEERALLADVLRQVAVAADRESAELARQRNEARLRFLTDRLPVRIAISDWETGAILYANTLELHEFGAVPDLRGRNLNVRDLYVDAADRVRLREALERDGSVEGFVLETRGAGKTRWTSVYAELMEFEGRRAVYAVRLDITDQRNAEEALRRAQRVETIGRFSGGIAHDFNNLLTGIIIQLDLLEAESAAGRPIHEEIAYARLAAERGALLVRRLTSFARERQFNPAELHLPAALADLAVFLKRMLGGGIEVRAEVSAGIAPVIVDRGELENAILNLGINARDAMPEGGTIVISAAAQRLEAREAALLGVNAGDFVAIAVADTGTGMPPEALDRAFEPFFTTKAVGRGTGLGLSLVYGFARQSGGAATIESALGKGTTVRLWLPLGGSGAAPGDAA